MGRKQDIEEVDAVAAQLGMDRITRRRFGDYLAACKKAGDCGSQNDRGDFAWAELKAKAVEFLEAQK